MHCSIHIRGMDVLFHPEYGYDPHTLLEKADEFSMIARVLRKQGLEGLAKQRGVTLHKTRVREGDAVGVAVEVLNYVDDKLYLRVVLDEPYNGRRTRHFYHAWEVVDE